MLFTLDHEEHRRILQKFIAAEINPFVGEWEKAEQFPSNELGAIACGGVPMAIGVQTDMATPALARFGSDEVRREFLAPAIAGDAVACIGVSEPGAGPDAAPVQPD